MLRQSERRNRWARRCLRTALACWLFWAGGGVAARADCSADQDVLGFLRWIDHLVVRGTPLDPDDANVLAARYRGLQAGAAVARLQRAGHMQAGSALRQLLGLTEAIVAEQRIEDMEALDGVLQAVYLQLTDECEAKLGTTLKDWVSESRELIEDDAAARGDGASQGLETKSVARAVGLTVALIGLIGAVFGVRLLWVWVRPLVVRRVACSVACDLIIGDSRFQGVVTMLARRQCRFGFPESTLNDFRSALARTTNCTLVIGQSEIPGAVQALGRDGMTIGFHVAPNARDHAAILERSVTPAPRVRQTAGSDGGAAARPARRPDRGPPKPAPPTDADGAAAAAGQPSTVR